MSKKKVLKSKKTESPKVVSNNNNFLLLLFFAVFVALVAAFLELRTKQVNQEIPMNTPNVKIDSKSTAKEKLRESIKRCGDFPEEVPPPSPGGFSQVDGPVWSQDCMHIAWSLWEGGISWEGSVDEDKASPLPSLAPKKITNNEGVFVFTKATKNIQRVYVPQRKADGSISYGILNEWLDNDAIAYTVNEEGTFAYNLTTKKTEKK